MSEGNATLVFGLNRSGSGAVSLLTALGEKAFIYDDNEKAIRKFPVEENVVVLSGGCATAFSQGIRTAVVSPGIPPDNKALQSLKAQGIKIISEVELAFLYCKAPIVAVTGTNGKSSAVTIIHTLLEHEGYTSYLAGNIGVPFSAVVAAAIRGEIEVPDWYVLEVSSYQLALTTAFKPRIAVYTGYAPDHLDWHGSEEAYVEAKVSIASRLEKGDTLIFPENSGIMGEALCEICKNLKASVIVLKDLSMDSDGMNDDSTIEEVDPGHRGYSCNPSVIALASDSGELLFKGQSYNLYKLLKDVIFSPSLVSCAIHAALGTAAAMGMNMAAIVRGLSEFTPLEHRLEDLGSIGSVRFINDSKATNIDATSYALRMCSGPVVLLLGGRDKGSSYKELLPVVTPSLKVIVAFGEAKDKIVADLTGIVPLREADSFGDALAIALKEASFLTLPVTGAMPSILLSPACSSFDEFANFEERGRAFKRWVSDLKKENHLLLQLDDCDVALLKLDDTDSGDSK